MYEFVFEKAWDIKQTNNVTEWIQHVADERSGVKDENMTAENYDCTLTLE